MRKGVRFSRRGLAASDHLAAPRPTWQVFRHRRTRLWRAGVRLALGLGLVGAGSAWAGITASVEPRQFSTDDAARMTVTLSGGSVSEPALPEVGGLHFVPAGQSSQMQSINGAVSSTLSFTYMVVAEEAGSYSIPPVKANIDGAVQQTAPISVRVARGSGRGNILRALPAPAAQSRGAGTGAFSEEEEDSVAFLRVHPSKTTSYIGELVPVQIKAYFREGLQASLTSLPALNGSAFTLHSLSDEPQRTREVAGNRVFSVLTWYTGMSAIKEGEFPVSAHLDATVLVPDGSRSRRRSSMFDGFFDDDLFASFFGRMQEKNVTLASADETVQVIPLPLQGRPDNFGGAVGRFDVTANATPMKLTVGDPVTLNIEVTGYGNFDRVSKPSFASEDGFKVYSPNADFKARDTIGYEGVKTFEQAVIPQDPSLTEIPSLAFSFFDPDSGHYRTARTQPIPVQIAQAPLPVGQGSARSADPPAAEAGSAPSHDEMRKDGEVAREAVGLHLELGNLAGSLQPSILRPWFLSLQAIPFTALCLGVVLRRRNRRLAENPGLIREKQTNRAVDGAMTSMDRALRGGDVAGFFRACRSAVQERLGGLWGVEPLAITLADIRRRLPEATEVQGVFETADAVAYSGRTYTRDELKRYRNVVKRELATLGAGS